MLNDLRIGQPIRWLNFGIPQRQVDTTCRVTRKASRSASRDMTRSGKDP